MKHPSALISALLDGELNAIESAQLHGHLASCGRCSAELQDVQRVRAAIRSLPVLDLPPDLMFEGEPNVVPFRRRRYLIASAAAVVAVIVTVATLFAPEPPPSTSYDDLARSLGAVVSRDPAFGPGKVLPVWGDGGVQQ